MRLSRNTAEYKECGSCNYSIHCGTSMPIRNRYLNDSRSPCSVRKNEIEETHLLDMVDALDELDDEECGFIDLEEQRI